MRYQVQVAHLDYGIGGREYIDWKPFYESDNHKKALKASQKCKFKTRIIELD